MLSYEIDNYILYLNTLWYCLLTWVVRPKVTTQVQRQLVYLNVTRIVTVWAFHCLHVSFSSPYCCTLAQPSSPRLVSASVQSGLFIYLFIFHKD
jgi:hypothetical protein